jgi:hypothetical protein
MTGILFRGKRIDNGEWVNGDFILGVGPKHGHSFILPRTHIMPSGCHELDGWDVDPKTIGRMTCLTDRNGYDIFSGDLMMHNGKVYVVVDDGWRFMLERNLVHFGENDDVVLDEDTAYESLFWGNFHDAPKNNGNGQI